MAFFKGAASEGARAASLLKKREKEREELEKMKQKISEVLIGRLIITILACNFCRILVQRVFLNQMRNFRLILT